MNWMQWKATFCLKNMEIGKRWLSGVKSAHGSIVWHYIIFYHDVGEISDLSQSEAPNLVMWRVMVMQPRPRLLGDEVVVGPNLMFRKMDPWNVIRNILQDKTDKNQL